LRELLKEGEGRVSDPLDILAELPLSNFDFPQHKDIVKQLQAAMFFEEDSLDLVACCTLEYLCSAIPGVEGLRYLLEVWKEAVARCWPDEQTIDIVQAACERRQYLFEGDPSSWLSYVPLEILKLKKDDLKIFTQSEINSIGALQGRTEFDLFTRFPEPAPILRTLRVFYEEVNHFLNKDYPLLKIFYESPLKCIKYLLSESKTKSRNLDIFLRNKGLDGYPAEIYDEIGKRFKLTRERVRQLVNQISERIESRPNRIRFAPLTRLVEAIVIQHGGSSKIRSVIEQLTLTKHVHRQTWSSFLQFFINAGANLRIEGSQVIHNQIIPSKNLKHLLKSAEKKLRELEKLVPVEEFFEEHWLSTIFSSEEMPGIPALVDLIGQSREIGIIKENQVGLREWKWAFPRTLVDKIYATLVT
jgi:hypothetical protein